MKKSAVLQTLLRTAENPSDCPDGVEWVHSHLDPGAAVVCWWEVVSVSTVSQRGQAACCHQLQPSNWRTSSEGPGQPEWGEEPTETSTSHSVGAWVNVKIHVKIKVETHLKVYSETVTGDPRYSEGTLHTLHPFGWYTPYLPTWSLTNFFEDHLELVLALHLSSHVIDNWWFYKHQKTTPIFGCF